MAELPQPYYQWRLPVLSAMRAMHAGRFAEVDLDVGQSFRNSYERSKFEAEGLVRSQPDLPFTIMRPSGSVSELKKSGP